MTQIKMSFNVMIVALSLLTGVARAQDVEPPSPSRHTLDDAALVAPSRPDGEDDESSSSQQGEEVTSSTEDRMEQARRLQYAGWATFTAAYVGALVPGIISMTDFPELAWVSLVPLTGPAIMLFGGGMGFMGIFSMLTYLPCFVTQLTGFIILVAGHRQARPDYEPRRRRRSRSSRSVRSWGAAVAPNGAGLSVAGWFR